MITQTKTDFPAEIETSHSTETAASHEIKHETTLYPESVFHIGSFTVTNSLINSWLAVFIIVIVSLILGKKIKKIPSGVQNYFETIVAASLNLADSVTGDRQKSKKIFPLVFGIFIFILLNNWLGLLPGVGSIGFTEKIDEELVFVPFLRGSTADLNTTLGLALLAVVGANVFGIITVGAWRYFNKFINLAAIAEIPHKIKKEPTIIFVNPLKMFVGLIEIVGELAKIASLSFRLFGNIFAGEVLLASLAVIFAFLLPIPFMFLEILIGIIQALIFAMLTLVYFTIASAKESH